MGIFKETSAAVSSVEDHQGGNEAEIPALREETKAPELVLFPEGRASGDLTAACLEALQSWGNETPQVLREQQGLPTPKGKETWEVRVILV